MSPIAERAAFRRAIVERPLDDVPRLVFSDWLDEHAAPGRLGDADRLKAELIRLQCGEPSPEGRERMAAIFEAILPRSPNEYHFCSTDDDWTRSSLWAAVCLSECWRQPWPRQPYGTSGFGDPGAKGTIRRGFVDKIEMTMGAWREYGDLLVKVQPVTELVITDPRPVWVSYIREVWPAFSEDIHDEEKLLGMLWLDAARTQAKLPLLWLKPDRTALLRPDAASAVDMQRTGAYHLLQALAGGWTPVCTGG